MLSILIPTYNYNIFPLVLELRNQSEKLAFEYEIIVLDDFSELYLTENQQVNNLINCSFEILQHNIGRSAIRNLLAKKAKFANLLFLDADTMPQHSNFIKNYFFQINETQKVVYGGIVYQKQKPQKKQLLRWIYGQKREALSVINRQKNEYLTFLTLNFMISKSVFETIRFNENMPNLRHEDTLFSFDLKQKNIKICHIDNPVLHFGIESSLIFIKKSEEALDNLFFLIQNQLIDKQYLKISKLYFLFKKYRIIYPFSLFFDCTKPIFLWQLQSNMPSILVFDLYRLCYLCKNFKN